MAVRGKVSDRVAGLHLDQVERRLEDRSAPRSLGGADLLHELVERILLMLHGQANVLPYSGQVGAERGAARYVGPHDHPVDKVANDRLVLCPYPTRHRNAYQDVLLAGEAREQGLVSGHQHGEHRCALGPCQRLQPTVERFLDVETVDRAVDLRVCGSRTVGWQLELGQIRQSRLPERAVSGACGSADCLAVLAKKVGVFERERRPFEGNALRLRLVEVDELGQKYPHRRAVAGDVVHRDHEDVILLRPCEERRPHDRTVFEVERRGMTPLDLPREFIVGPARRIDLLEGRYHCAVNVKIKYIAVGSIQGAKHHMTIDQMLAGSMDGRRVNSGDDSDCDRDMVSRGQWVELADQP